MAATLRSSREVFAALRCSRAGRAREIPHSLFRSLLVRMRQYSSMADSLSEVAAVQREHFARLVSSRIVTLKEFANRALGEQKARAVGAPQATVDCIVGIGKLESLLASGSGQGEDGFMDAMYRADPSLFAGVLLPSFEISNSLY